MLFSLLAVFGGAALAAVLYRFGFIASVTSFAMVVAAGWLYAKGAGTPPQEGLPAFIVVVIAGVACSLLAMLGTELYGQLAEAYPTVSASEILPVVIDNLFNPVVWRAFAADAAIFVGFAALGAWSTLRRLRQQAKT